MYDDVTSTDGSIQLHNNTWAADDVAIDADVDVIVGEFLDPGYSETTLTGEGALTVEAGQDIKFGGDVDASVDLPGDLTITAGDEIDAYGNLTAHNGSVVITSGSPTTYLYKDVTASENVTLHGFP